ncbi:MAG: dihydroorotate dehydrogenase [Mycoplasmatales bacterium]
MYNLEKIKELNNSQKLAVNLPGFGMLKNPIFIASGCGNFGQELEKYIDLNELGGITLKSLTKEIRPGNLQPRVGELKHGMINSIGLANPGVDDIQQEMEFFNDKVCKVFANVAGSDDGEYLAVIKKLNDYPQIHAYEINVSCPNVKKGCMQIGTDPVLLEALIKKIKLITKRAIYVKLTPNTSDIVEQALAAERGGADGITMINTIGGMGINYQTGKPIIAQATGGVSGPILKPVALKMVYEVTQQVTIPVIGMGGIFTGKDVIEFLQAGAQAVAIGTANLLNPCVTMEIIEELGNLLQELDKDNIQEFIKMAHPQSK